MGIVKYTLLLPICDRPHLFEVWSRKVASLNVDRAQTQVIICDAEFGSEFGNKCRDLLATLAFAEVVHVNFNQNDVEIKGRNHWRRYLRLGSRVSDNYQRMMPYIKGEILLILEDDVEPHPDVFNSLLESLYANPSAGLVGAITHEKNRSGKIIAFQFDVNGCIPDDNFRTVEETSAQAFGCVVTYANLFKNYNMRRELLLEDASPDLCYCRFLRTAYGLQNYLDGRERCKHYFLDGKILDSVGYVEGAGITEAPESKPYQTRRNSVKKRTQGAPIFLIAGTGRSGSTWLQRVITSHRNVIIWGEPHGATTAIEDMFRNNMLISWEDICKTSANSYFKEGTEGWIPNLSSMATKPVKTYLANLYALHFNPATVDKGVWGVKTIDWTPMKVIDMYRIFPRASFIFLHRDIEEVRASFNKRKGWWPDDKFKDWIQRDNDMTEFEQNLPDNMHSVHVHYNDYADDPEALCKMLEESLDFDIGSLSRDAAKINRKSFHEKEVNNG